VTQNLHHPSIQRIARVAGALGDLLPEVMFIGAAITPLLHADSPLGQPRPTKEVDAVVASTDRQHLHRWRSPQGDLLDLMPAGNHPGGSGRIWDTIALETSEAVDLGVGSPVRYASAPCFLALKWAAYDDRGRADSFASHDLEDILALMAARPTIVEEVASARPELRDFVGRRVQELLTSRDLEDLLAGNLGTAQDPASVIDLVRQRLQEIARVAGG